MKCNSETHSNHTTDNGRVSVCARFVAFDQSNDPIKAFCFNAKQYTVEGVDVTPTKEQQTETENYQPQNVVAEYIGPTTTEEISSTGVIFYHLDEFNGLCKQDRIMQDEYATAVNTGEIPPLPSFTDFYILSEIHELCHWAIPNEDQPTDGTHSYTWNALLSTLNTRGGTSQEQRLDFAYEFESPGTEPVTVPDLRMRELSPTDDDVSQEEFSDIHEASRESK